MARGTTDFPGVGTVAYFLGDGRVIFNGRVDGKWTRPFSVDEAAALSGYLAKEGIEGYEAVVQETPAVRRALAERETADARARQEALPHGPRPDAYDKIVQNVSRGRFTPIFKERGTNVYPGEHLARESFLELAAKGGDGE